MNIRKDDFIFISYSSKDVKIAEIIQEYLEHDCFDVWRDKSRIEDILEDHSGICFVAINTCYSGICSVAISSDNSKIVSGSRDNTVKVWDLNTGKLLNTFEGHSQAIAVATSSDNAKIVSGSHDKTIKVWDLNTGTLLNTLEGHSSY